MKLKNYSTVLKNFTYLSLLNGLNIVLPLLVIPYLTNVIGASHYGVYAYILVLVQNINVITQFGFQFTATKKIAQNRDDKEFVEQYSSNVLCARVMIATLCVAGLFAAARWTLDTEDRMFMFLTSLGIIYGDVFIPTWLFQGMERMKYITIVNASAKILFTVLIFVIVLSPYDYIYIQLLNSCGYVLAAVLSMVLMRVQFHLRLRRPVLKDVIHEMREGISLFFSMIGIDLYRNMNVVILNFFVSDAAVGVYALAEKVIKASQSFITPISQALFPHVSVKIKKEGIRNSLSLLAKSSMLLMVLTVGVALAIFFCGDMIISLIGKDFTEVKPLLTYMYPVLIFGCLNFLLGFVGLINMGQQKFFFFAVFTSGTLSLVMLTLLVRVWGVEVAAACLSVSEIVLFLACASRLLYLYRQSR